jgi:tetratricopeptide (TPR) repeat protein
MRYLYRIVLALGFLPALAVAQANPDTLHDALVLENGGSFEAAAKVAKSVIDSGQPSGVELGRGYVILAVAWQGAGDLTRARAAFEQALQVLEHDREHPEDYASALENYAGFYNELGQRDVAARMLRQALHIRQRIANHTGMALSLTRLAELNLAENRVREAHRCLREAASEANASPDFVDDDKAFLLQTEGWLALAEHRADAAIAAHQSALELVERSRGGQHWLVGWQHMLLGKAYAKAGDLKSASAHMQTGLTILDNALGRKNPKYFAAELAYSRVLDQVGLHAQAIQMRATVEKTSRDYYGSQCAGCTINVAAFH